MITIRNVDKIVNRKLAGGWSIVEVINSKDAYIFVCEIQKKIYDPMSFQPVTKTHKQTLTLGRDETSKGSYLLVRSDNTFLELDKNNVGDMERTLFYLNELIYK